MAEQEWEIEFLGKYGVVNLRATGQIDLERGLQWSTEALEFASVKSSTRLLHDLREMTPAISTTDIYLLPEVLGKLGLTRRMKVAILVPNSIRKKTDFVFFETVSRNKGFRVKLFNLLDDAQNWLMLEE